MSWRLKGEDGGDVDLRNVEETCEEREKRWIEKSDGERREMDREERGRGHGRHV